MATTRQGKIESVSFTSIRRSLAYVKKCILISRPRSMTEFAYMGSCWILIPKLLGKRAIFLHFAGSFFSFPPFDFRLRLPLRNLHPNPPRQIKIVIFHIFSANTYQEKIRNEKEELQSKENCWIRTMSSIKSRKQSNKQTLWYFCSNLINKRKSFG